MNRRATAAVILTLSLLVGLGVTALAGGPRASAAEPKTGNFVDDDGNVHEGMIEAIVARNITAGCATQRYCPDAVVTRGAMAAFVARALGLQGNGTDFFDDDGDSVHQSAINAVAAAGIAQGTGARRFSPSLPVTRAQMATFLARALHLATNAPDRFQDVSGNTHRQSINAIAAAGISAGCNPSGTRFCPDAPVRRDQMATFIGRALGLQPVTNPTPTSTPGTTATTRPPGATTTATTAPPTGGGLNPSATPTHGSRSLVTGFVPDPSTAAVAGGGSVNVSSVGCVGFAVAAPTFRVEYTAGPQALLRFFYVGGGNPIMVVRDPFGNFRCGNDSSGTLNPTVDFNTPSHGTYTVWVGTTSSGATTSGTLSITEQNGNHP